MKAFSSPAPRKILLVVILVALLATALTACSEDIPVTPASRILSRCPIMHRSPAEYRYVPRSSSRTGRYSPGRFSSTR